jgi:group I intron endonuclease
VRELKGVIFKVNKYKKQINKKATINFFLQKKYYTTNPSSGLKHEFITPPIKSYGNAEQLKEVILTENRNKPGIYRWINNLNNKTYVGSGINLSKRLGNYYNKADLTRNPRPITQALLKHGHSNFTLEIREYCPQASLLEREQFYLDLLKPEYNILKFAYSMLGFKHSPDNLAKFKLKTISPEHKEILSLSHTGKMVSQETRDKLAVATATYRSNNQTSAEGLANLKASTIEREGVAVKVLNIKTNEVREFTNQTEAGVFLGVTRQAVYNAIKRGKPVKEIYYISKKG